MISSALTTTDAISRGLQALHDDITPLSNSSRCLTTGYLDTDRFGKLFGKYVCSLRLGHAGSHLAFVGHDPCRGYCDVRHWEDDPPAQREESCMTVTPYLYTMIELAYVDEPRNHDKFYRGFVDHQTFAVRYQYGRNGYWNQGSWTDPKPFPTFEKANEALMSQIQAKLRKGYSVMRSLTITCAKEPSLDLLAQEVNRPLYSAQDATLATSLVIANV